MTGPPIAPTFFLQREKNGLTKENLSSHPAKLKAAGYIIQKTFRGKFSLTLCRLMLQDK